MIRIAIITGSTQRGTNETTARWVYNIAKRRTDAEFELIDIIRYDPLLSDPVPSSTRQCTRSHFRRWSEKIASFDAFIFVTPEDNYGTCAALKNASDFLAREWSNKAAGFVSQGSDGGARAVEQLRLARSNLTVAAVTAQVLLSLFADFENFTTFKPGPRHERDVSAMLDQLISWGKASKGVPDEMNA